MMSVSLDGFTEGPDGGLDWHMVDDELDMPKIVYSRTLEQAGWNMTVVGEVVPEDVLELKSRPGTRSFGNGFVLLRDEAA